jgi:hypothetical protein
MRCGPYNERGDISVVIHEKGDISVVIPCDTAGAPG